ncbi:MAG: hypothetical protein LIO77_01845 [Rikenellaceae bacterium]|nr:hypothetical protein [Rikenellaceae bacterium]
MTQYYIPTGSVSEFFKVSSQNKEFYFLQDASGFVKDEAGKYVMRYIDNLYDSHTGPRIIESDSLFYNTIYSWDVDKLIRMIKATGGPSGSENYMSATKIIIHDNQILRKDIINFQPAIFWRMD